MELLVVLAVATLLLAIIAPAFSGVRETARLAKCASNLRGAQLALWTYSSQNACQLPPFAFSSYTSPDLQASGHWMGVTSPTDPAAFGRAQGWQSVRNVNLGTLCEGKFLASESAVCPSMKLSAPGRWSSYCMRVPTSRDLVGDELLPGSGRQRLFVYLSTPGGYRLSWGGVSPQVRTDREYRLDDSVSCGDGTFDVAREAAVSDAFWRLDGGENLPMGGAWPHRATLNVAAAGGVRAFRDDGSLAAWCAAATGDDGAYGATFGERVWQRFDGH
jgi:type II secretory pathway pseudopilin PulG